MYMCTYVTYECINIKNGMMRKTKNTNLSIRTYCLKISQRNVYNIITNNFVLEENKMKKR